MRARALVESDERDVDAERHSSNLDGEGSITPMGEFVLVGRWVPRPGNRLAKKLDPVAISGPGDRLVKAQRQPQIVAALATLRAAEMDGRDRVHRLRHLPLAQPACAGGACR